MQKNVFQELVYEQAGMHFRDMPWRSDTSAYSVFISEMMLQQTQVDRVRPKYKEFMELFPDFEALSNASLQQVLAAWTGLGYNRRAKFLHNASKVIMDDYNGSLPRSIEQLVALPGIGPNTAGAIKAYVFNDPVVFIETNIRSVFIYHFFQNKDGVDDKELLPVIEEMLDRRSPREWYWALMDYGVVLKKQVGNSARASKHYKKQSVFEGSVRQLRGKVLRQLTEHSVPYQELKDTLNDERLEKVLESLEGEGFISQKGGVVSVVDA